MRLSSDHRDLHRGSDADAEEDLIADVSCCGGIFLESVEESGTVEQENRAEDDVRFGEFGCAEEGA